MVLGRFFGVGYCVLGSRSEENVDNIFGKQEGFACMVEFGRRVRSIVACSLVGTGLVLVGCFA